MKKIVRNLFVLLPLFIVLLGCVHSNQQSNVSHSSQSDSIVFTDEYIKEYLETDSIEVVKKQKHKMNGDTFQQIIFIDYKYCNKDKRYVFKEQDSIIRHFNFKDYKKYFNDTSAHAANLFPELNSTYLEVKKYKGKYVLTDNFTLFSMLSDSFIMETSLMEHAFCRIHHSEKENNVYKFQSGWSINNFAVEVIILDEKTGLQLWKTTPSDPAIEYYLKMPLRTALKLPIIYSMNDLGEGGELEIDFDKTNYDSIFQANQK